MNPDKKYFKWLTVSSWINETILFFQEVDIKKDLKLIREEVKAGQYFNGKQDSTVQRIFSEIVQKYLKDEVIKGIVYNIANSKMPVQEKSKYLLVPFLADETLRAFFIQEYIFPKYQENQKIFTQIDLDIFFEYIFLSQRDKLPPVIVETLNKQGTLGESSIKKARNQIFKFLEDFNFANKKNGQIIVRRPLFSVDWFLFTLAFHYPEKTISIEQLKREKHYRKYLISEQEVDEYLIAAKQEGKILINEDKIEIQIDNQLLKIA